MTRGYDDDEREGRREDRGNRIAEFMQRVDAETAYILRQWPEQEIIDTADSYARKGWIKKPYSVSVLDIVARYRQRRGLSEKQKHHLAKSIAFVSCEDKH